MDIFKIKAILIQQSTMWFILLVLPCVCLGDPPQDPPTAQVPQGTMVGTWFTSREGRNIQTFLGIPFAQPPLGPLRFMPPQPPTPWKGVFYATEEHDECIQAVKPIGVEDCLYLNVYTLDATPSPKRAVMVFIHGGGFEYGTAYSSIYGPSYLLDEDVVLVTMNYRLGILGFLSLEDHVLPGNLGLKDQRAALRWVQQYILYFGGDPRRVTIFGQSAGGASVNYHMKFTYHEGLFRAAILQSGSTYVCWAFQPPGSQDIYVRYIADKTGCDLKDHRAFVECLRHVPADSFGKILQQLLADSDRLERKLTILPPMVEPPGTEDPFVTADPWSVPTSVPMMAGVNKRECLSINIPPYLYEDMTDSLFKQYNMNYTWYLPLNLQYNFTAEDPNHVSKLLKEFYLGEEDFSRPNYLDIVDLITDGSIIDGVFRAARSNKHKTYFYLFDYHGLYSAKNREGDTLPQFGPSHGDELYFFFHYGYPPDNKPEDVALSKQMVKMWTNFAKYMDPTPDCTGVQWEPVKTQNIEYLHIGQTNLTMEKDFLKSRMDFWDKLPFRNKPFEYKWPYAPSTLGDITEKYLRSRQGQQESLFEA